MSRQKQVQAEPAVQELEPGDGEEGGRAAPSGG